ncbi:MAG TPA: PilZ domain-containing protein [Terriglobales bacterium]|jgi:hypothetical protein|nr:PilZ domain-containing protein [Terriglobales bacterium]
MHSSGEVARSAYPQQRKYRRFRLHYPVHVKFALGDSVSELQTLSQDVSIGGLFLQAPAPIPQHCPVSFVMMVQASRAARPIELVGEGKVVRVEAHGSGAGFGIAVECNRPISQMENYLGSARTGGEIPRS